MMMSMSKSNRKHPGIDEYMEECPDYVKEDEDNENH